MAAYEADSVIVCCSFISNYRARRQGFFLQENMTTSMEVSKVIL